MCIIISAAILQIGRCRCYKIWPSVTRWLCQEENEHKGPAVKKKCFSGNRINNPTSTHDCSFFPSDPDISNRTPCRRRRRRRLHRLSPSHPFGWSIPSTTVAHEQVTQVAVQCRNKPSRARSNPVFSLSLFSSNSSTL